jgi:hypothetical protein
VNTIRYTALALCAFTLLSSARALIPGLCATLAAQQAGAEKHEQHSCCHVGAPQSSQRGALANLTKRAPDQPDCAFCHLAKGMLKTEARVAPPRVNLRALPAKPDGLFTCFYATPVGPSRPRDPPHPIFA